MGCPAVRAYLHLSAASFLDSKLSGGDYTCHIYLHYSSELARDDGNSFTTPVLCIAVPASSTFLDPSIYQISLLQLDSVSSQAFLLGTLNFNGLSAI